MNVSETIPDEQIQKDGANARALGRSFLDNPHLRRENMPVATGETIEAWARKERLWNLGWEMENAIRS